MSENNENETVILTTRPASFLTIGGVLLISLILSLTSLFVYDRYYATHIIIYDLPGKLLLIKKSAEEGKITFQQAEQLSVLEIAEAKKISNSVPANYIVISGDAVLGKDIEK